MDIYALRKRANREEIDYLFLMQALADYKNPRLKVQALLRSKDLIRIKKGLYIFGEKARQEPYSKEVLANLIYGPSAISLEYALSFYGMIPERVTMITCITNNRNKSFDTPVGNFEYQFLASKKYAFGITQIALTPHKGFLIATKEKALADMLMLKSDKMASESELKTHLIENLRIDESALAHLDFKSISVLADLYKNKNVQLLKRLLEKYYG